MCKTIEVFIKKNLKIIYPSDSSNILPAILCYSHYESLKLCSSNQVFIDPEIVNSGITIVHPFDMLDIDICSKGFKKNDKFDQFITTIKELIAQLKLMTKSDKIIFIDLHYLSQNSGVFNFYSKNSIIPFKTPEFFFSDTLRQQSKLTLETEHSKCSKELINFLSREVNDLYPFQVCIPIDKSSKSLINYALRAAIITTTTLIQKSKIF